MFISTTKTYDDHPYIKGVTLSLPVHESSGNSLGNVIAEAGGGGW